MAKKFIALEETSQAIKTTVEETKTEVESVGTAVNEIKEDVGDGAGTDLVTRVANLEAKIDALQTAIEGVPTNSEVATIIKANGGGTGFKPTSASHSTSNSSSMRTIAVGETLNCFICASDTGYCSVRTTGTDTATITINSNSLTINKTAHYLPLGQKVVIKNTSSIPVYLYGICTLYEVE